MSSGATRLLSGLHNLDYPFLRDHPDLAPAGPTIALIVVFAIAITTPAVILERMASGRGRMENANRLRSQLFANVSHELLVFTTRAIGEGTGLGLYLSRRLVREHGGDLRLVDGDDPGASFEITAPLEK